MWWISKQVDIFAGYGMLKKMVYGIPRTGHIQFFPQAHITTATVAYCSHNIQSDIMQCIYGLVDYMNTLTLVMVYALMINRENYLK